ncbi:hypothetical protein [Streptomyces sp. GESEQ-35]|uniref:hypothetical protein n=1 Tax=Streptomyces sp. GESEQ-35 TaxID=2812657 RepID=UPI001B33D93F|nr:hypothetical protein [Streptomyces sp. GESEQ-35]
MSGSPYDDHRPEQNPAERPVQVSAAATLLILSAFLVCTIAVYDPAMTQTVYLLLFVTIGAAIRFCKGGHIARITATVAAALLFLYLGPFAIWGLLNIGSVFQEDFGPQAMLAFIASAAGVSLLYVSPSRAYFRAHRRQAVR